MNSDSVHFDSFLSSKDDRWQHLALFDHLFLFMLNISKTAADIF